MNEYEQAVSQKQLYRTVDTRSTQPLSVPLIKTQNADSAGLQSNNLSAAARNPKPRHIPNQPGPARLLLAGGAWSG